MNFTNLIFWSVGIITSIAGVHNIDSIQRTIWKAQAQLVYDSRTETWGSPRFLSKEGRPKKDHFKKPI